MSCVYRLVGYPALQPVSIGDDDDPEKVRRRLCRNRLPADLDGGLCSRRDAFEHRASDRARSEEHTSELQSLMRISYAVFCLKKKTKNITTQTLTYPTNRNDIDTKA